MNQWMLLACCVLGAGHLAAQPAVDHHLHLLRSATAPPQGFALNAEDLIRQMDEAGIRRGVVLSIAYQFGNPFRPAVVNEYERVKEENDWTAMQAARYADRLVAFCGINPLKDYAIREIDRCAQDPRLRRGLKLHFGNSDVQMDNPNHVAQIRRVFAAANRHRMAIVVHVRSNIDHNRPWGERQARIFVESVLPCAAGSSSVTAFLCRINRSISKGTMAATGNLAVRMPMGISRCRSSRDDRAH